jgi:hypothetical protein
MLIRKGGISRVIDEKDLQRYKDKGYAVAEAPKRKAGAKDGKNSK